MPEIKLGACKNCKRITAHAVWVSENGEDISCIICDQIRKENEKQLKQKGFWND